MYCTLCTSVCDVVSGHTDEILDVCFNWTGTQLVSGSADKTARVWDTHTGECVAILTGHSAEISKVVFNPQVRRQ
jgi:dynein assembly factor with WDR repeat domains 1